VTTYSTNTQNIRKPISRDDAVVVELLERLAQVCDHLLIGVRHRLAEEVQVPSTERARSLDSVARCVVDSEYESTLLESHLLQRPTHILYVLYWSGIAGRAHARPLSGRRVWDRRPSALSICIQLF